MLKILHTADWHIGKKFLMHHHLMPELRRFLDWLFQKIDENEVDVLLVSGDIFDSASPSPESRELYYAFLTRLVGKKIKVIMLGGNHDLPIVLDAPRELLAQLNVTVLGKIPDDLTQQLLVLPNAENPEIVVGLVPFLRDADIRKAIERETYTDRVLRTREGIKLHYRNLTDLAKQKYPNLPLLMTGHLFAKGGETSQSEREIQVGNLADIDFASFEHDFAYLALGHLHRPQKVGKIEHFRYSGSPIVLGIDEIDHKKRVILLTFDQKKLTKIENLDIPIFRNWHLLDDKIVEIEKQLVVLNQHLKADDLSAFVFLNVKMEAGDVKPVEKIRDWQQQHHFDRLTIIGHHFETSKSTKNLSDTGGGTFLAHQDQLSMRPIDFLRIKMDEAEIENSEKRLAIENAFRQIESETEANL